ncbi:MAG: hypothetical protein WA628_04840 [Terriglobales bacterium]
MATQVIDPAFAPLAAGRTTVDISDLRRLLDENQKEPQSPDDAASLRITAGIIDFLESYGLASTPR